MDGLTRSPCDDGIVVALLEPNTTTVLRQIRHVETLSTTAKPPLRAESGRLRVSSQALQGLQSPETGKYGCSTNTNEGSSQPATSHGHGSRFPHRSQGLDEAARRRHHRGLSGGAEPHRPALAGALLPAARRSRVRDLRDLYQFTRLPFDRGLVRRIAVLKCWETRYAFDPAAFLAGLPQAHYEWPDLRRLVRRGAAVSPEEILRGVQQGYAFLGQLTEDEGLLANDPYGRQRQLYARLVDDLRQL
jgi:hypothetical protein